MTSPTFEEALARVRRLSVERTLGQVREQWVGVGRSPEALHVLLRRRAEELEAGLPAPWRFDPFERAVVDVLRSLEQRAASAGFSEAESAADLRHFAASDQRSD